MTGILSSKEVGFVLVRAGLSPFSLDTDVFQIVYMGENYLVHTDRLLEIYIEKKVPLDKGTCYCPTYRIVSSGCGASLCGFVSGIGWAGQLFTLIQARML